MYLKSLFFFVSTASSAALQSRQLLPGNSVCGEISTKIAGDVYFPLSFEANFFTGIHHYMTSSSQLSRCVVEVANANDISEILKVVARTRTPFAVKSGGHASNPGFSSTSGVLISLVRIDQINLSADKKTVEIGLGNASDVAHYTLELHANSEQRWTDVYEALNGKGVNVVGGRVSGPGTGGFTLGGGYSWLTNQYGLTVDTVVSFNLILPNGGITTVDASKPDLFFALKGGLNRFGIVSSMILKTVPQTNKVYGGTQIHGPLTIPALIKATTLFQTTNTDPKAQVILTINGGLVSTAIILFFYDGPGRPAAFDVYNDIPFLTSTLKVQSHKDFTAAVPSELAGGSRGAFHTLSTTSYTENFMKAVHNESKFYGALGGLRGGILISYDIEPFMNFGQYATESAFPHADSPLPLNLFYKWVLPGDDAYWRGIMQQSVNYLTEVAKKEGIYSADMFAYPNYALSTYSGNQLYGPTNAARMRSIQAQVDPTGIMLLAGGFTI